MPELLLELFSEEIPARMQARAADELKRLVTGALKDAGLDHGDARAYVTPRRLALVVENLPEKQPDLVEERRGPRADAPDKAVEGFLRANGVSRAECEERDTGKGVFLFAVIESRGADARDVLPGLLAGAIGELPWPKSMRWGTGQMRWVRSLERVLCVFAGAPLKVELRNAVPCGGVTAGHRFLAPEPFEVTGFADYEKKLRDAWVVLDREERKRIIAEGAAEAARAEGLALRDDPALVDEVAGLVEWPVVLAGRIDDAFMDVPDEVLATSMRAHQKYFSLLRADGSLAPRFVVVANTEAKDGGAAIVAGNERVLRARLSDAKFFWDQDRNRPLESRVQDLAGSVFHAKLGTMAQKVERITALAGELAPFVPGCDAGQAMRAARLAKADLVTEMVYEFPELQGTMGRYYALHDGEETAVADAIATHYSPAGPNDACPTAPVSVAVALADKLDTLVGFFAVGEKPTGSRDPYALRRAALGVIRLILENRLRISLSHFFNRAFAAYDKNVLKALWQGNVSVHAPPGTVKEMNQWAERFADYRENGIQSILLDFFADRLKVHLREQGVRHDYISAIFALGEEDDLVRLMARVDALSGFLGTDDGTNLLAAYKRASNIVAIEEKKDGVSYDGDAQMNTFLQQEERDLATYLYDAAANFNDAISQENYVTAMEAMSALRSPVDRFFDNVTVNADDADLRANRLRLLSQFRATLGQIADFSLIEG